MPAKPGGRRMKTITNHVGILILRRHYMNNLAVLPSARETFIEIDDIYNCKMCDD